MAKAGGGAAYQRLTKPEDGLSQSFQYWGGINAQKNAAHKLRQEREQIRADEEDAQAKQEDTAKAKRLADYKNTAKGFDTKYKNVTLAVSHAAEQANDRIYEHMKVYEDESKSPEERGAALAKARHLEANFTTHFKSLIDPWTSTFDQYYKAKGADKTLVNEKFETFTQNGLEGIQFKLNEDDKWDMYALDTDGVDGLDLTTPKDVMSSEEFAMFSPENVIKPKNDLKALVKEQFEKLEVKTNKNNIDPETGRVVPYLETTIKDVDPKTKEDIVESLLNIPYGIESYKEIYGVEGDIDREALKQELITYGNDFIKGRENSSLLDAKGKDANADRDAKRAQDQLQFERKQALDEQTEARLAKGRNEDGTVNFDTLKTSHETTSPVYPGGKPNDDADNNYKYVPKGSKAIPLPEGGIKLEVGEVTETADNFYVHPDGKYMTVTGIKSKKGEENKPFEYTTKKNPSQVNRFIKAGIDGVETHGEFIKKFNNKPKEGKKETSKSTKPKQVIQNGVTYTLNEQTGEYE